MRKTKIVATIGPACDSPEMLKKMIEAGVDVFRFNMKHNEIEWHSERMELVDKVAKELGTNVAIMLDLQGPEVRIDDVPEEWSEVEPGQTVRFSCPGDHGITLDHPEIFRDIKVGQVLFADDGFLEFRVTKTDEKWAEAEVVEGGKVKPRKTVNFPQMHLSFPALIDKDIDRLSLAARHHVDFVALSFVRTADDLRVLRKELKKFDVDCQVMAKIEHPDAIENFNEILAETDTVIVARGDLGVEYPLEEVPGLQKFMINRSREEGKPIVVATQMLESMIENPRPTRAEVSDVATAVYDGADAVWLSGESAMGKYPVKAVKTLARIATRVESQMVQPEIEIEWKRGGVSAAVVASACEMMNCSSKGLDDVVAFVVLTETGKTANLLARMRPDLPILALTSSSNTADQLRFTWGVKPLVFDYNHNEQIDVSKIIDYLLENKEIEEGKKVIMIYGETWGSPGQTSVVRIQEIAKH